MGLIQSLTKQLSSFLPKIGATTSDEVVTRSTFSDWAQRLAAAKTRGERVEICRQMYNEDPRAKESINRLAADATKGGLVIEVTGGQRAKEAQQVADEVIDRLGLDQLLDDWTRLSVRDGDSFLENSIDRNRLIVAVTRKPTLKMHRNSNKFDLFDDPAKAFWLADFYFGQVPGDRDVTWFAQWQILHARWEHDKGRKYGTPQFAAASGAYKKLSDGELNMAIKRKVHRGQIIKHIVEGSWADVEAYKQANRGAINNPIAEYFSNKPGSIATSSGDVRLGDIADVKHHIQTWATASPVPLEILGYGEDLNRDILEDKLRQYQEDSLPGVSRWIKSQIARPIIELQWMLLDIWPKNLKYKLSFGYELKAEARAAQEAVDVAERQAEVLDKIAAAGIKLKALGLPVEILGQIVARQVAAVDPELKPEEIMTTIQQAQAAQPDEVTRMASLARLPIGEQIQEPVIVPVNGR